MKKKLALVLLSGLMGLGNCFTVYGGELKCETIKDVLYIPVAELKDGGLDVYYENDVLYFGDSLHRFKVYRERPDMYECECGFLMFKEPMQFKNGSAYISVKDLKVLFGYKDKDLEELTKTERYALDQQKRLFQATGNFEDLMYSFLCDTYIGSHGAVLVDGRSEYMIEECDKYLQEVEEKSIAVSHTSYKELLTDYSKLTVDMISVYEKFNELENEQLGEVYEWLNEKKAEFERRLDAVELGMVTKHM